MSTFLKEGDRAPDFEGHDQNGVFFRLSSLFGRMTVLYFYPEDDTPACTAQACSLRDKYEELCEKGFTVVGISPNDQESHKQFQKKYNLPFLLISDPDHAIINKYGVWGEKNLYGRKYTGLIRTTFLVNTNGVIARIFLRPRTKVHAEEILRFSR